MTAQCELVVPRGVRAKYSNASLDLALVSAFSEATAGVTAAQKMKDESVSHGIASRELRHAQSIRAGIEYVIKWNLSFTKRPDITGSYKISGQTESGEDVTFRCDVDSERFPG